MNMRKFNCRTIQ